MNRMQSGERDSGGFTIKTEKTEKGSYKASIVARPEINPTYAANERTAIEAMTTRLDELSRAGKLED